MNGDNGSTQHKSVCDSLQNLLVSSYNTETSALSRELAAKPVTCEQLSWRGDVGAVSNTGWPQLLGLWHSQMGVTGSWHWAAWHRDNNVTVGPHPAQVSFQWRLRTVREGPASACARSRPCCEVSLGGSEARLNTWSQTDSTQGNMDPQNINVCVL